MESRRGVWQAVVRLAVLFSAAAVGITIVVDLLGDVSPAALAATVAVIGFVASWVLTGRTMRVRATRAPRARTIVRSHATPA